MQVYREHEMGKTLSRNDRLSKFAPQVINDMTDKGFCHALKAQPMNATIHEANKPTSVDALNGILHNPHYSPDPNSLKTTWNNIEPFMRKMVEKLPQ